MSKNKKTDRIAEETIELIRKEDGSEFLDLGWSSVQNISFIPVENVNHMNMEKLQEVCGIAFVKRSYFSSGIMIAHEGYLIDRERLIHASSVEGKTVNVPFLEYLNNNINNPRHQYFHQLALGLTYLFDNNIIFNDLKTSNVMEKNDQIAIIDIGYSTVRSDETIPEIS